ncbi:hypothetical protein NECID01_0813 [Nematocida sp. AWRm77]|nr:hypothetical protein NECID01_0813 [Nematocida sp. AWRm77]
MELIGEGEKAFFRALVEENGLYSKEKDTRIERILNNYADYSVCARKNGTQVNVHINISKHTGTQPDQKRETPLVLQTQVSSSHSSSSSSHSSSGAEPALRFNLSVGGSSLSIEAVVLEDTGLVNEVVLFCIRDALQKIEPPNVQAVFKDVRVVFENILEKRESAVSGDVPAEALHRTTTYGAVGEKFFISPVQQEQIASDAVIHVTGARGKVQGIAIERGGITPEVLGEILRHHSRGGE